MTAKEITNTILIQIPVRFPGTRVWRHNVGAAHTDHGFVRFGIPGESDVQGIAAPSGKFIAIEVKAGRDRLTPRQESFLAMIRGAGGIALVARDVDDTLAALESIL